MIRCLLCVFLALLASGCSTTGRVTPAHSVVALQEAQQGTPEEEPFGFLTPEQQAKLGVGSLTLEQQQEWLAMLTQMIERARGDGELGRIAKRYLEREGWEPMEVIGFRWLTLDEWTGERQYLVVRDMLGTWAIENPIDFLAVGPCWGKSFGFGPTEIIDSTGHEASFLVGRTKRIR